MKYPLSLSALFAICTAFAAPEFAQAEPGNPGSEANPGKCSRHTIPEFCEGDEVIVHRCTFDDDLPRLKRYERGVITKFLGHRAAPYNDPYFVFEVTFSHNSRSGEKCLVYGNDDMVIVKTYAERVRAREEEETAIQAKDGLIDRAVYDEFRREGRNHKDALAGSRGPVWLSFSETSRFLDRLSQSVYAFDREYLLQTAKLLSAQDENSPIRNEFVSAALLPFLRNFGYREIKKRWIDQSMERISASLMKKNIKSLLDTERTDATRRLALQMLGISLTSSQPQMSDEQRRVAGSLVRSLGEAAAGRRTNSFQRVDFEKLLHDLAQNPYLTARAATDMALLEFLRGF